MIQVGNNDLLYNMYIRSHNIRDYHNTLTLMAYIYYRNTQNVLFYSNMRVFFPTRLLNLNEIIAN
jgi:hypothetical protein